MPELEAHHSPPYVVAVLDDDKSLAQTICRVFNACGLDADAFNEAEGLLCAAESKSYDAFVLDWKLSNETAELVVHLLRAGGYHTHPIFLYTGQLAISDVPIELSVSSAISRNQLHYRQKPYSHKSLATEILEAISLKSRSAQTPL